MEDADLPGFDSDAARAWLDQMAGLAAAPFRPRAEGLGLHASALELRRLLALAPANLPRPTLIRLWRELEAVRLGPPLRVAVWGGAAPELTVAMARRRFGAASTLSLAREPEGALAAAQAGSVAVLAVEGAWWGRLLARPALRVVDALWGEADPRRVLALAVAAEPMDATGGDATFWVTDAPGAPTRIEAQLGDAGFAGDLAAEAGGLKLFALAGYVQTHDARLAAAPGRLTGVIGTAPIGLDP